MQRPAEDAEVELRTPSRPGKERKGFMLNGLYAAAAGMAAQQTWIDALANDIANVNTFGYKQQRLGFRDLLYNHEQRRRASAPARRWSTPAARSPQGAARQTRRPARRSRSTAPASSRCARRRHARADPQRRPPARREGRPRDRQRRAARPADHAAERHPARRRLDRRRRHGHRQGHDGRQDRARRRAGAERLQPIGDSLFLPTAASGAPRRSPGSTLKQGYARGVERRPGRRDDRHDRRAARATSSTSRAITDPGPAHGDRQRDPRMMTAPPIDTQLCSRRRPRRGPEAEKLYDAALQFEQHARRSSSRSRCSTSQRLERRRRRRTAATTRRRAARRAGRTSDAAAGAVRRAHPSGGLGLADELYRSRRCGLGPQPQPQPDRRGRQVTA